MKRILSLVLCLLILFSLMPNAKANMLLTACGDAFIEVMTERYGEADMLEAKDTFPDTIIVAYNYEKQYILIFYAGMHYGWLLDSVIDVIAVQVAMEEVVEGLGLEDNVFIMSSDDLLEILENL